ncbi:hypothetical protein FOL47_001199, partial [Perkinsus chesapeaki]
MCGGIEKAFVDSFCIAKPVSPAVLIKLRAGFVSALDDAEAIQRYERKRLKGKAKVVEERVKVVLDNEEELVTTLISPVMVVVKQGLESRPPWERDSLTGKLGGGVTAAVGGAGTAQPVVDSTMLPTVACTIKSSLSSRSLETKAIADFCCGHSLISNTMAQKLGLSPRAEPSGLITLSLHKLPARGWVNINVTIKSQATRSAKVDAVVVDSIPGNVELFIGYDYFRETLSRVTLNVDREGKPQTLLGTLGPSASSFSSIHSPVYRPDAPDGWARREMVPPKNTEGGRHPVAKPINGLLVGSGSTSRAKLLMHPLMFRGLESCLVYSSH